jgi:hypothetical protein
MKIKGCVPLGVLSLEIMVKRLHTITQDATLTLIKTNNCNKTGDLDIFAVSPLTPETGVQLPVGLS